MSNANITLHIQEHFLKTSEAYLDLYLGDTSSHPYVTDFHTAVRADTAPAVQTIAAKTIPVKWNSPVTARLNWHAVYCIGKFGKPTPGGV